MAVASPAPTSASIDGTDLEPSSLEFAPATLEAFLRAAIPGISGPFGIQRVGGGQSNPTFFVTIGKRRLVVRKKPSGEVLPSAHAVDREYRVISALAASDVPVPRAVLFCDDTAVTGTPFYVMERLDGRVFHDAGLPGVTASERTAMYLSMAETLAKLHDVDPAAIGLADFGRAGNYFERQVARWARQYQQARWRDLPDLDRVIAWLPAHLPPQEPVRICHGDFRIGNLMFHPSEPRVVGVLDWELSTLGEPLADVAFSALGWDTTPEEYGGLRGLDHAALGIPPRETYLARYFECRRTPAANALQPFHTVFALFRFAVIFEGIAVRARAGTAVAGNAAIVGELAPVFARRAAEVIEAAGTSA